MEAGGEPRGQRVAVGHDDQHRLLRLVQLEEQRRHGVGRCRRPGCPSARRRAAAAADGSARARSPRAVSPRRTAARADGRAGCRARRGRAAPSRVTERPRRARPPASAPARSRAPNTAAAARGPGRRIRSGDCETPPAHWRLSVKGSSPSSVTVPLGGPIERAEDVEQRALAAARRPHDRGRLAGRHRERDVLENPQRSCGCRVVLGDV